MTRILERSASSTRLVSMPGERYRSDIDGLRALAVLAVILCHAEFSWASGGYVGVDVFFVISGFLITRLIRREVEESRFSFSNFYLRRVRRLIPALCFTLMATLVIGCFLSHPIRLESLGRSTIWTALSVSNIHFWMTSGYFSAAATTKPLLHTWSLGVEEQFYLVWPAIAILLLTRTSRRITLLVLGLLGLASWVAAELLITTAPTVVFYWMPLRICEFVVGGLLVWSEGWKPGRRWQEAGYLLGLAIVCGCCVWYDPQTRFPGSHAMLVALGTGLLIQFGRAPFSSTLLDNRIARGIGLISYSAYLAHWPLLVFLRGENHWHVGGKSQLLFLPAALLLGWGMYAAIEQPFRRIRPPGENRRFVVSLGLAMCVVIGSGLALSIGDGWPQRPAYANPPYAEAVVAKDKARRFDRDPGRCRDPKWLRIGCPTPDKRVGLVIGNSHARDGDNIMAAATQGVDRLILSGLGGCPPLRPSPGDSRVNRNHFQFAQCERMNEEQWTPEYYDGVDYVVVSTTFSGRYGPDELREYIDFIQGLGIRKIVVIGNFIHLREELLVALPKAGALLNLVATYADGASFMHNAEISRICEETGCFFVDKKNLLADETGWILETEGVPFTWDRGHLTWEFATMIGRMVRPEILRYLNDHSEKSAGDAGFASTGP